MNREQRLWRICPQCLDPGFMSTWNQTVGATDCYHRPGPSMVDMAPGPLTLSKTTTTTLPPPSRHPLHPDLPESCIAFHPGPWPGQASLPSGCVQLHLPRHPLFHSPPAKTLWVSGKNWSSNDSSNDHGLEGRVGRGTVLNQTCLQDIRAQSALAKHIILIGGLPLSTGACSFDSLLTPSRAHWSQ